VTSERGPVHNAANVFLDRSTRNIVHNGLESHLLLGRRSRLDVLVIDDRAMAQDLHPDPNPKR
jgi:hypothetical protein